MHLYNSDGLTAARNQLAQLGSSVQSVYPPSFFLIHSLLTVGSEEKQKKKTKKLYAVQALLGNCQNTENTDVLPTLFYHKKKNKGGVGERIPESVEKVV